MKFIQLFFLAFLLSSATSFAFHPPEEEPPSSDGGGGFPWFFGPGSGFNIPGFGAGFGAGFGGPGGRYGIGGVRQSSVVCNLKGPCYHMKLTCPAKCFYSFSGTNDKGSGYGGGGGGCNFDCQDKCLAYCSLAN